LEIEKVVDIAVEEYRKHHLSCTLNKECWAKCDECFRDDLRARLKEELKNDGKTAPV
jgi:hypothetical protein